MRTNKLHNGKKFKIELLECYKKNKHTIKNRLEDFSKVKSSDYFYEMIYCLLTPQSSAKNADKVVTKLKSLNFQERDFDPEKFLRNKSCYIRFHKTKSKYLIDLKKNFPEIQYRIINGGSNFEIRDWLVKNVYGMGFKEASHFLRNIGKKNLAILDRHILRNLERLNVIKKIPKSLSKKKYLEIEERFKEFSKKIKIPLDELDLLFWSMETGEILK